MWPTSKLTDERAKRAYVAAKRDVARHVQNVVDQARLRDELALAERLASTARQLREHVRPRVYVPLVDDVWLPEQRQVRDRQRFLVLHGPSRTGKTVYAANLVGPGSTLEVNCANARSEPDLRQFAPQRHRCIVFDEAHAQMVLSQKRLFQAPATPVQMASSATNCFGYSVFVHGVLLVVCSNRWSLELAELPAEDRDWLQANSVCVEVSAPLWQA